MIFHAEKKSFCVETMVVANLVSRNSDILGVHVTCVWMEREFFHVV